MEKTKKFILTEKELPTHWYNIVAEMQNKPLSILNPATKQPMKEEELYPLFAKELSHQELNQTDAWIEIPEEVRDKYKIYRPTPLVRAYDLEKALDTPAHIYFKNESVSPVGSHKLNTALAQAYYCKQEGITHLTTETGAGQWGTALALASKTFGLELVVYMVKISYEQKPYRRSLMQTWGAQVIASPSMSTNAGRKILSEHPNYLGSLGTAISEAIELAMQTPNCKYTLGSVLNHVLLHQTVIGLEAKRQLAELEIYPDEVFACCGGGSNFGGIAFPFIADKLKGQKVRAIAVEPTACPTLTKGIYAYDYGDVAKLTPIMKMYTLGHNFIPPAIHAGGLRYHGVSPLLSYLYNQSLIEATSVHQSEVYKAGKLFAETEGIIPAPESAHAIAAVINEAISCREKNEPKNILFCLSGHGYFDMAFYDAEINGGLKNFEYPEELIKKSLKDLPNV
jgi:tryptophan synthase beta chain